MLLSLLRMTSRVLKNISYTAHACHRLPRILLSPEQSVFHLNFLWSLYSNFLSTVQIHCFVWSFIFWSFIHSAFLWWFIWTYVCLFFITWASCGSPCYKFGFICRLGRQNVHACVLSRKYPRMRSQWVRHSWVTWWNSFDFTFVRSSFSSRDMVRSNRLQMHTPFAV